MRFIEAAKEIRKKGPQAIQNLRFDFARSIKIKGGFAAKAFFFLFFFIRGFYETPS